MKLPSGFLAARRKRTCVTSGHAVQRSPSGPRREAPHSGFGWSSALGFGFGRSTATRFDFGRSTGTRNRTTGSDRRDFGRTGMDHGSIRQGLRFASGQTTVRFDNDFGQRRVNPRPNPPRLRPRRAGPPATASNHPPATILSGGFAGERSTVNRGFGPGSRRSGSMRCEASAPHRSGHGGMLVPARFESRISSARIANQPLAFGDPLSLRAMLG